MSRFIDSVNVGRLPAGTYTVSFIGAMLGWGQTCTSGPRDTVSLTFQVRGALATKPADGGWAVYPTPATGGALSLLIPSDKEISSITLLDAVGRPCYASTGSTLQPATGGHWRLHLPALPTGAYTLRLGVAGGAAVSQRVLLE
ncbi:T9SS type A sorting domain-containing protein [Hymenobacter convexus]|uniref:T9SS type A sorting domain-containing protein n=1 Tax=Hymenobacter sp. CA1UV-4 TaxID=3063782 RepID=UPI0027124437|nr:T9SS type A sorting domain-containing protein [Hymenobacter sp. CA1UV-4]MDO7850025.1 T9SS type A sorting domain-containing protein [Hymenobacter sp. CA1UV-4]